jgi:hypothetical protein
MASQNDQIPPRRPASDTGLLEWCFHAPRDGDDELSFLVHVQVKMDPSEYGVLLCCGCKMVGKDKLRFDFDSNTAFPGITSIDLAISAYRVLPELFCLPPPADKDSYKVFGEKVTQKNSDVVGIH